MNLPKGWENDVETFKKECDFSSILRDQCIEHLHLVYNTLLSMEVELPHSIYNSISGFHLVWNRLTLHIFVTGDEDAPNDIYSIQIFSGHRPPIVKDYSNVEDAIGEIERLI